MSKNVRLGHFRRFSSRNSFDENQKSRLWRRFHGKDRGMVLFVRWGAHLTNSYVPRARDEP